MSTTPIAGTPATTAPAATTATDAATGFGGADSQMFMKLLVANLQHQDPMAPQDSSTYMQQISSMTMVEQLRKVGDASTSSLAEQRTSQAIALLGKTVTYADADGTPQTGKVERIATAGGVPTLTVAGIDGVDPSTVAAVSAT